MREELLEYYVRELTYLRQMGTEFARKYPGVAGRLLLEPDDCEILMWRDCWRASRSLRPVHRRIDDDFPELSESLLKTVHPSYLRPLPSMTIVSVCRTRDKARKRPECGFRAGLNWFQRPAWSNCHADSVQHTMLISGRFRSMKRSGASRSGCSGQRARLPASRRRGSSLASAVSGRCGLPGLPLKS